MLKLLVYLLAKVLLSDSLVLTAVTQLEQQNFFKQTQLKYGASLGQIYSQRNLLIYFYYQGEQINQNLMQIKSEFKNTYLSFQKALKKNKQPGQQIQGQILDQQQNIPTESIKSRQKQDPSQQKHSIEFYSIRCFHNQKKDQQNPSICQLLHLNQAKKFRIIFFTQNSELVQFIAQPTQQNLIYFITKLRQIFNPAQTKKFDQQLEKIAVQIYLQNTTIYQQLFAFIYGLKRYLTSDTLKFFVVFIIVPFLFGYISTKLQQRQNKKLLQKYSANVQNDQPQQSTKKPFKMTKELKQKLK